MKSDISKRYQTSHEETPSDIFPEYYLGYVASTRIFKATGKLTNKFIAESLGLTEEEVEKA